MRCPGCGNLLSDPLDCTCPPGPSPSRRDLMAICVVLALPLAALVGVLLMV